MGYDAKSRNIHKDDLGKNLKTKTEFPWTVNPEVEMNATWNRTKEFPFTLSQFQGQGFKGGAWLRV